MQYNSKNDYPVCEKCERMLLRLHEVMQKYQDKRRTENGTARHSPLEITDDENSQDDQAIQPQPTGGYGKKSRGKYQRKVGTRKYRYALLQSQSEFLIVTELSQTYELKRF
jgi:hypothetical protein